jgi:hypothetical protein
MMNSRIDSLEKDLESLQQYGRRPMDSIKLGLITVCCIISVKLTDWPSVV